MLALPKSNVSLSPICILLNSDVENYKFHIQKLKSSTLSTNLVVKYKI